MIKPSPKNYGFVYSYNGSEYATHVEAESPEDARQHLKAMSEARLVGPLVQHVAPDDSGLSSI